VIDGLITQRTLLSGDVGANSALCCDGDGTVLLSAWCGRLDVWRLDRMARIQSLAFPYRPADGEIVHRLLPPFAGRSGSERWPEEMLPIAALRVSEDGSTIAMAAGSRVHLFEQAQDTGEVNRTKKFGADGSMLTSLALSADGSLAAATSAGGNFFVWDLERRTQLLRVELATSGRSCAFLEDWSSRPRVAVGEVSGTVRAFDLDRAEALVVIPAQAAPVEHLVALGGSRLVSAGPDGAAHVWDLSDPIQPAITVRHADRVSDCAALEGGEVLLTAGFDGMVGMWSTGSGRLLGWYRESLPLYRLCALPGAQTAVTSTASSIHLLDLAEALERVPSRTVPMPPELSLERGPGQTPRTAVGLPLPRAQEAIREARATSPGRVTGQRTPARASGVVSEAAALLEAALLEEDVGRGFEESPRTMLAATALVPREVGRRDTAGREAQRPAGTPRVSGSLGPLTDLGLEQDDIGPIPGERASVEVSAAWWPEEERAPALALPREAGSGLISVANDFTPAFTIEASNYTPAPQKAVASELLDDRRVRSEAASAVGAGPALAEPSENAGLAGLERVLHPRDLAFAAGGALAGGALAFFVVSAASLVEGTGEALGAAIGAGLAVFGGVGLRFARKRLLGSNAGADGGALRQP
jgi:hypothetical protein